MTPEEQAARIMERLFERMQFRSIAVYSEGWAEEIIAAALRERDEQWEHTLAEMEACYLKREGDIRSRIEQARKEERVVMKRARDLLRDFVGEVGLREEDAFAHLAHDLLSARAQESER